MSSTRSSSLGGDGGGGRGNNDRLGGIVKMGYLKKLKTMKKKFFVLRAESADSPARIEYYDSEKKWRTNHSPKRCIVLKTCFNINRRLDTKHKNVIALYTKDDCFCLVLDSEDDLEDWLKALLSLQHGEDIPDGEEPRPLFEHVWQVNVQEKGLGNSRHILGQYLLCLTERTLSLVRIVGEDERTETIEFSLMSIRRCGYSDCFFYMELGRSSVTGAGDLWMQTEDTNIAQNMHAAILNAMTNSREREKEDQSQQLQSQQSAQQLQMAPRPRNRSCSANEASKPISVLQRRQTHGGVVKPATYCTSGTTAGRERCDSLPSRARTTSEGHHHSGRSLLGPHRPHSMYSPPVGSSPVSPGSTDSAGSSLSIDEGDGEVGRYGHSLTPDEPVILEEEYVPWTGPEDAYVPMAGSLSLPIQPQRKVSPGSPSQGSYVDACSPCSSSPLDTLGGYMAMSPGSGVAVSSHSRASSLAEEGYVPMAPVDDGYVDMDPVHHRTLGDEFPHGNMSPASSCSVTSGTPSTDLRFSEYQLEKVSSYFTPSEEDETSMDRPIRAYSVGSRPDSFRRSNRLEIVNQGDSARERAFSVGSKLARAANRNAAGATLTPPLGPHLPSPGGKKSLSAPLLSNSWSGPRAGDLMEMDFSRRRRTGAATGPYLDMRPAPPAGSPPKGASPYVDMQNSKSGPYMDMQGSKTGPYVEMQSTKPICMPPRSSGSLSVSPKTFSGMTISGKSASPPSRLGSISPRSSFTQPAVQQKLSNSFSTSTYVTKPAVSTLASSPKSCGPYLEMRSVGSGDLQSQNFSTAPITSTQNGRNPPVPSGASPKSCGSYMDMRGRKPASPIQEEYPDASINRVGVRTTPLDMSSASRERTSPIQEENNITPANRGATYTNPVDMPQPSIKLASPMQEKYADTIAASRSGMRTAPLDTPQPRKPPEGYVEMTCSKPSVNSAMDSYRPAQEDYMNMGGDGRGHSAKRKGSRKDKKRNSSQPIAIQPSSVSSSSSSSAFSFSSLIGGRKLSSGTPPKTHPAFLPLDSGGSSPGTNTSPFSSLGRNQNRKTRGQRISEPPQKDADAGGSTPTGSATIFPFSLNSPQSPTKPFPGVATNQRTGSESYDSARKCPVDATSGTVRISYPFVDGAVVVSPDSHSGTPESSSSSSEQPTPVNAESLNDLSKTEDDGVQANHNYVNYSPQQMTRSEMLAAARKGDDGDYAVMRPSAGRKTSAPVMGTADVSLQQSASGLNHSSPTLSSQSVPPMPVATKPGLKVIASSSSILSNPPTSVTFGRQQSLTRDVNKPEGTLAQSEGDTGRSLRRQHSASGDLSNSQGTSYSTETNITRRLFQREQGTDTVVSQRDQASVSKTPNRLQSAASEAARTETTAVPKEPNNLARSPNRLHSSAGETSRPGNATARKEANNMANARVNTMTHDRVGQVHYVALDLGEETALDTPPSPAQDGLTYAEIDFTRSEGLRGIASLDRTARH